jgi:hypothetical protein
MERMKRATMDKKFYQQQCFVFILLVVNFGLTNMEPLEDIECPKIAGNSACPCYKFEDGE